MNRFPSQDEFRPTSQWIGVVLVFEFILLASMVGCLIGYQCGYQQALIK